VLVGAILTAMGGEWISISGAENLLTERKLILGITLILLGVISEVTAYYWRSAIQPWIGPKFVASIESVVLDFRYWFGLIMVTIVGGFVVIFLQTTGDRSTIQTLAMELHSLRADVDCYAMPRKLSDQQIRAVHNYLVAHPQPNDAALSVVSIINDDEAHHYADQIFQAIRGTGTDLIERRGWAVDITVASEAEITVDGVRNGAEIRDAYTCKPGSNGSRTAALLREAFSEAHVYFSGSGGLRKESD
jgi:hypothetical protein